MTRILASVAVLVSAGVHLYLWFHGFKDLHVVGPAFIVNAVAGVAIAVLLLASRHWIGPFLAAGFGASTLGAFVLATTVGLFGLHERWIGWSVWTGAISEAVAIVTGLVLLARAYGDGSLGSRGELEHRSPLRRAHLH